MKTDLITQLCGFSCVPDCWAHYMRERGWQITTEDILKNHRDLCWWNPPKGHQYGTVREEHFLVLASRYLLAAQQINPSNSRDVLMELNSGKGVFGLARKFRETPDQGHAFRIVGAAPDYLEILIPGLPHGTREHATLPVLQSWETQFFAVS